MPGRKGSRSFKVTLLVQWPMKRRWSTCPKSISLWIVSPRPQGATRIRMILHFRPGSRVDTCWHGGDIFWRMKAPPDYEREVEGEIAVGNSSCRYTLSSVHSLDEAVRAVH